MQENSTEQRKNFISTALLRLKRSITFVGYVIIQAFEKVFLFLKRLLSNIEKDLTPLKFLPRIKQFIKSSFRREQAKLNKNIKESTKPKDDIVLPYAGKFANFLYMYKHTKSVLSKKTELPLIQAQDVGTPKKSDFRNIFLSFSLGIFFTFIFILFPYKIYSWFRELPNPALLSQQSNNAATKILDRKGHLLYEIYIDKKYDPVPLSKIPSNVINATLAIEDSSFYSHHGIRLSSIIRAVKATLFEDNLQGASTITQQLIKNVLLSPERTFPRKIKEIVLSLLVETKYSKNAILEMYLNNIPYGGTAWGIQSASQKFFGKSVDQLDLAQAAMLAGLPSAPSIYSPIDGNLGLAKQRQGQVLDRMVALKYITLPEAGAASAEELHYVPQSEFIRAPHFVAYVRNELEKMYGKRYVAFGGLTITTTLDLDLQDKAQNIVREEVEKDKYLNISNGAAVVLENRSRGILAYVGSIDYFLPGYGAFDVISAYRQPGSSIKPITYALAFSKGYTPATIIDDSSITFQTSTEIYKPVNYDGKFHGKVTLRTALGNSLNIPAVKLVNMVGPDNMVDLGRKMGLRNWKVDGSYGLSVTLGGKEIRLIDLANVYSTFSRGGIYKDVTPFISIKDVYGYEIYKEQNTGGAGTETQVVSPEVSYLITNILSDNSARVLEFGYNSALVVPGHTVSVKTGTTDSKRDNWTFGYTPTYTVGVWVGNNDNTPMNPYLASGITGAAPIWNKVMSTILIDTPNEPFIIPDGIFVFVDAKCGNKSELFIKGGNVPKTLCVEDKKDSDKEKKKKHKN